GGRWGGGLGRELKESAGKVMSRRLRYGAPWLKTVLVQCAWAATRSKNNYLHAQFLRLEPAAVPKRPSWQWPPRFLQPPTTYSAISCRTATSDLFTLPDSTRIEPPTSRPPNQRARLRNRNSKSSLVKCSSG